MIRYKLTDAAGNSYGGMRWAAGITNRATGNGTELCTDGFIHGYETPEQAAFMRPAHVPDYFRLWEIEVPEVCISDGTKEGYKEATLFHEASLPRLTPAQCAEIAIRASLLVYHEPTYVVWTENWLTSKDRSKSAASAAASAAERAAWSAASAAESAESAAWSAASAAESAASAASTAANAAERAASAAESVAASAAWAAERAAWVAERAARFAGKINLVDIIREVTSRKEIN